MNLSTSTVDNLTLLRDERHGPLPPLLLVLTMVTGLVDAISYLKLGNVFVANMTGNVVFLGFAIAGAGNFSISASLAAIAVFLLGALAGGRLELTAGHHRGRHFAIAVWVNVALVGAALAVSTMASDPDDAQVRYALIALLSLAMGIQNATARCLAVPDLTTTVLTLTLTGLAADSTLAGGKNPNPGRRLTAIVTMFVGATVGAYLVLAMGVVTALASVLAVLVLAGIAGARVASSAEPWTLRA